jgi:hypothetical protein
VDVAELRSRRLFAQGLRGAAVTTPAEVVGRALAVQSQEYLPAQWGLVQRLPATARPDAAAVAGLLDRGEILRTHVLRPTWHFVAPGDARWLLELSAERVHRLNGTYYRRTGVVGADAVAGADIIARTVAEGHRTRAELSAALEAAGRPLTGAALALLVMYAELERLVISGEGVGKQRTYAAFDERVPASAPRERDEALAELAERYLATRGPADPRDLATWSGFTVRDARAALAAAGDRTGGRIERIDDEADGELWHDAEVGAAWSGRETPDDDERVDLLQAYDEYIMGHAAPRAYLQPPGAASPVIPEYPLHAMMAGGVMVGRWAPTLQGARAIVRLAPWRELSRAEARSRDAGIAEVEAFLAMPVSVTSDPVTTP